MKTFSALLALLAGLAMVLPSKAGAQQLLAVVDAVPVLPADAESKPVGAVVPLEKPVATPPHKPKALFERWLDLTTMTHSERYRNQFGGDGYHYFKDGQQRSLVAGRVKLDREGKYAVGFRASSGRTFNWSYGDYAGRGFTASLEDPQFLANLQDPASNPGIYEAYQADEEGVDLIGNMDSAGWEFYLRELYLSASPTKHVTFEVGSFGFERGYSTEITTFDDDGYLEGERLRLKDRKHLFFDEISLTAAHFGDFQTPNLFARGQSFSKPNYRQAAFRKQLTGRIAVSGEYNWISNVARTHTTREAITVGVKESRILDKVRLEAYEMLSRVHLQGDEQAPRQGFALVGERKVGRVSGDFGFASIDRNYGLYTGSSYAEEVGFSLNGDNYNTGIRVFSHLSCKLTDTVTAFGFYTHLVGQPVSNLNRQGLNAGLTFDLKALVNRERRVF